MSPTFGAAVRVTKLPIGTAPALVLMVSWSSSSRLRRFSGKRTRMSTDLSVSEGRYSETLTPFVTSWTAVPTASGLAPYFAASALSTSSFQSMPGSGRPSSTSRVSGLARDDRRDLARRRVEQVGIDGAELERHRLAGRRAGLRLRHLHDDAGNVLRLGADLVEDGARLAPLLPVDELELHGADRVLGHLVASRAGPRRRARRRSQAPACRGAASPPAAPARPSPRWRGCRAP